MALQETLRTAEALPDRIGQRFYRLSMRARWIVYGIGALILLLLAWHADRAAVRAQEKAAAAAAGEGGAWPMRKDVMVTQNTIGTVVSPATVQVTAQVTGKLLAANFREGDIVHKGDLLFQIDPAPYQAALAQAEGQLARDQATLANDRIDLQRYQTLARRTPSPTSSW